MADFKFEETRIKGLYIIKPQVFSDERGYFMESYNRKDFERNDMNMDFVQDNESKSNKGVLRGLHFQTSQTQGKLVRVISGSVFDVAVDLREGSSTYGQWEGITLSSENKLQFYVPKGFAHGFLVLEDNTVFTYKCTDYYAPQYDSGIIWNDPDIAIKWPLDDIEEVSLSDKDNRLQTFKEFSASKNPFSF